MTPKSILVEINQRASADARLQAALTLAQRLDAHLTALYLVPEPYLPGMLGAHIPAELIREQVAEASRAADTALGEARTAAEQRGVAIEIRRESAMVDRLPDILAHHARYADLVVVGAGGDEADEIGAAACLEAVLMDTGRPALVIPGQGATALPPRRAIIAWNGTREAARAAHDAVPLLAGAEQVIVLVVDPQSQRSAVAEEPGAALARHLARHGLRTEARTVSSAQRSVGEAVLAEAAANGAELIVMGAYGHSRLREFVFGGVTEHLLRAMPVPVLFAH